MRTSTDKSTATSARARAAPGLSVRSGSTSDESAGDPFSPEPDRTDDSPPPPGVPESRHEDP